MALSPNEDDDETQRSHKLLLLREVILFSYLFFHVLTHYLLYSSDSSTKLVSEGGETGRSQNYVSSNMANSFSFKIQDKKGRVHRFACGMQPGIYYHSYFCISVFEQFLVCFG